ncbi:Mss4-like protein [Hyaloraphidium curvatum]|nr:Mss4-like protein [Hyaloraphidium curvatum]
MAATDIVRGGCNCGQITYEIRLPVGPVAICHCRNCRRTGGSFFSVNLVVPNDRIDMKGELANYDDGDTYHGQAVHRKFCARCHSQIGNVNDSMPGVWIIKTGGIEDADRPKLPKPSVELWTDSAVFSPDLLAGVTKIPRQELPAGSTGNPRA